MRDSNSLPLSITRSSVRCPDEAAEGSPQPAKASAALSRGVCEDSCSGAGKRPTSDERVGRDRMAKRTKSASRPKASKKRRRKSAGRPGEPARATADPDARSIPAAGTGDEREIGSDTDQDISAQSYRARGIFRCRKSDRHAPGRCRRQLLSRSRARCPQPRSTILSRLGVQFRRAGTVPSSLMRMQARQDPDFQTGLRRA